MVSCLRGVVIAIVACVGGCVSPGNDPVVIRGTPPPIFVSQPSTPKLPVGPTWRGEGMFGMEWQIPGGMTSLNAKRLTGTWPDGTSVVIYDEDTEGCKSSREQVELVKQFEQEWYRRKRAEPRP